MRRPILFFNVLIFLFCLPAKEAYSNLISRMQDAGESLVQIKTVYQKPIRTKENRLVMASYERFGTGVIIDTAGLIVTNTHIVAHAPHIYVALNNGKIYEATPVYTNEADFSFLRIHPAHPLKAIKWADSSNIHVGTPVVALGNSDLNQESIIGGNITNLLESFSNGNIELIEVNINLYKGDSGGPILDEDGRLLGLIMAKRKTQDKKSYAIASNKIRQEYLNYKRNMP